ncbi:uncharacterized protein BP01DRAFT_345702 [Aspergillus saccharolyticus JOP 1030-1]|uniref:Dockerin type 1 n=1 Tax=Aspergillus saccharolyticus JOP 1030-1 TaxID=1450539 RepID=A0A318ZH47_9EURO|nr:hypothetical protein BP01DRAFT_345702 [Aspergillus saccharolyticus JOP 1030-1]PYH43000.1 hypothetical protein BP01DRAFT_345702 [Aspergillus saccharolyticus JOP 1030-1]
MSTLTPHISILTLDPNTTHRLNACAYQQSALTTLANTQYAAFYTPTADPSTRWVTLARRTLQSSQWHHLTFTDYPQRTDDGHNTISIGICAGDGTIHVAFDHHCDELHYRISRAGLAYDARAASWTAASFGGVQSHLPGWVALIDVTYPRFVSAGRKLLFECRIGRAGAGSEALYLYTPRTYTPHTTPQSLYLHGDHCNPYPNGLSFHAPTNTLHLTWTNRHFVAYDGATDAASTAHKAQAGPNGPENNEGLYYISAVLAEEPDGRTVGIEWKDLQGESLMSASFAQITPIGEVNGAGLDSQDPRLRVRDIPRGSGIMNQEGQFVDPRGGVHVLNRENTRGREAWVYYSFGPTGWESWPVEGVSPTETGRRGKVVWCAGVVWLVLPENEREEMVLGRWVDQKFVVVWRGAGVTGEPLVDEVALLQDVLSFLALRVVGDGREVVVLDFDLTRWSALP